MEVSHQSSLGVRTRARTLALQRLQRASSPTPPSPSTAAENDDGSYLQLRSRRLEKALVAATRTKEKDSFKDGSKPGNPGKTSPDPASTRPRLSACSANSVPATKGCTQNSTRGWEELEAEASPDNDGVEASSGENVLEFDPQDRSARETTPCSSFIRDSEAAGTPGSTTRRRTTPATRQRATRRSIPTSEMEEFFAGAEQWQQRIFTDKYNFDPVNDCPLPGRYEWVRLDS
ncbi:unnamed protein product [Spirodela intermedia]|uniref:Cyclin-dependent kinase inhibitor domain-containing protein n=1 Tax=Spirodela intermedia TaxID=51605 RepID=A0A7I8IXF9_SPIIN|nr:unnamed protein product [Spirodela intermedia]CAA6662518.1 unnamed protein product [Spirodela intermedia]